ncbi:MAG: hypothetical protein V7K67_27695 [Nostoc sp.]|uniref:hypothetical protein n=1 Tax=Nostoc sp. TaxID=1180 RepID=UPI002FFAA43A
MNINNGELLSLLFDEPKLVTALNQAMPYISVFKGQTILNVRCASISSLLTLLQYRQELFQKLKPLFGYEICLECEETGASNMVATAERITQANSVTETRFLSLERLARVTSTSPIEVKKLLGRAKEVIHPMEDGSEMITENAFDSVVLQWAKSFKDNGVESMTPNNTSSKETRPHKTTTKVLTSELDTEDIIKVKTGKTAGSPNLTEKGIQQTLENFFSKVKLEDTSIVDAVSAFIEGTSEFGQALRKKIMAAYKKFTKGGNPQDIQDKLIFGAKAYLESMAATSCQE